jgi:lysophospholipase L1-like esterase
VKAALAGLVAAGLLCATPARAQTAYVVIAPEPPGQGVCPHGLCQPQALAPLFEALAAMEAGKRQTPVHILQIGDSHTAGDRITGKVRADLQRRFGRAGRGALPPGVPYDGYAPLQVSVAARGWVMETAPLQPPAGAPSPRVGLSGVRAIGTRDAVMAFDLEPGSEAGALGVCGREGVDGKGLSIEAGGVGRELRLGADEVCRRVSLPDGARQVRLLALGEGTVIDSLWLDRAGPGVSLSSLGRVGATLRDLASRDETTVAAELDAWRPGLIILAFGTNEGFDGALDPAAYETLLRAQIARLRSLAPGAALMVLGAPDALRNGATNGCSADRLRAPPPGIAVVRDVQRRVAADLGVAFWDWHGRMGGDCSADRLALRGEPFMRADRVHFTNAGADWIGGVLSADLLAAYDVWTAARAGAE